AYLFLHSIPALNHMTGGIVLTSGVIVSVSGKRVYRLFNELSMQNEK
ncbi:MAG: hypothetical protein HZA48_00990, partial [Planctomycetes bacterium]|nr:hypothetical protein [Planctomycetota bacterium]